MITACTDDVPGRQHLAALIRSLDGIRSELPKLNVWGTHLASVLGAGGRLLTAGNGGSAAQAEHLAAELLGRYQADRRPLAGLALTSHGPTVTSIANDYGLEQIFARQVAAHGRSGDVLVVLSTSGRSPNTLAAVSAGRASGLTAWALTGERPNSLAEMCDDAICVSATEVATVQEVHQVLIHLLCAALDRALSAMK